MDPPEQLSTKPSRPLRSWSWRGITAAVLLLICFSISTAVRTSQVFSCIRCKQYFEALRLRTYLGTGKPFAAEDGAELQVDMNDSSTFSRSVVLIENRPVNLRVLENFINYTTPEWTFEIFIPDIPAIKDPIVQVMQKHHRGFVFKHMFGKLISELRRNQDINPLLKSCEFWENVDANITLVAQMDSVLCPSNFSINDFVQYHYVGAPWPEQVGVSSRLTMEGLKTPIYGGNGGLSLRNRDYMLQCCMPHIPLSSLKESKRFGQPGLNEDLFYGRCFQRLKKSLPLGIASSFSLENMVTRNASQVVAMHKPNVGLMRQFGFNANPKVIRDNICAQCPPVKLILKCPGSVLPTKQLNVLPKRIFGL